MNKYCIFKYNDPEEVGNHFEAPPYNPETISIRSDDPPFNPKEPSINSKSPPKNNIVIISNFSSGYPPKEKGNDFSMAKKDLLFSRRI